MMKKIKGFPEYFITEQGDVLRKNHKISQELRGGNNRDYFSVNIYKNGRCYKKSVHRLLAENFLENPEKLLIVRHIDGNSKNNDLKNLIWGTHKQNSSDRVTHNTNYGPRGELRAIKLNDEKVKLIRTLYEKFNWKQIAIFHIFGEKFNITQSYISLIVRYKRWNHIF